MKGSEFFKFIIFTLFVILFVFFSDIDTSDKNENMPSKNEKLTEKDYVNNYCEGIKEFVLPDKTRVDCLTNEYAIEFDYAKKWAESIGQSLYYAKMTGKKPAVALILSSSEDKKYVKRINYTDKDITVFEIKAVNYEEKSNGKNYKKRVL